MVINLFHVVGYKPNENSQSEVFNEFGFGVNHHGLYCDGTSGISSCIDKLFEKGCTSFSVGYLGEISIID